MELSEKKKILVVDDDLDTVEILRIKLEGAGFKIIVGRDGQECLDKCQSEEPNLIIVDVMMPKISGFKAVKLLKSDKRFENMPIILLTARTQEADRQMAEAIEADGYITKPFDPDGVLKQVKELLEKIGRK